MTNSYVTVYGTLEIDADYQKATAKVEYDGQTVWDSRELTTHQADESTVVELEFEIPEGTSVDALEVCPTEFFSGGRYGVSLWTTEMGFDSLSNDFALETLNLSVTEN